MSDDNHVPFTNAEPPFNSSTADIILRSADGVNFRVHKCILTLSSDFFDDMFSLPQPAADSAGAEFQVDRTILNGLAVVPCTEDSGSLDILLRCIYPIDRMVDSLDHVVSALRAARKYLVRPAIAYLEQRFVEIAKGDAVRAWALAAREQWEREMTEAAKLSLSQPYPTEFLEEFEYVSAADLIRLHDYRRACTKSVIRLLYDLQWLGNVEWMGFTHDYPLHCGHDDTMLTVMKGPDEVRTTAVSLFATYLKALEVGLKERPRGSTVMDVDVVSPCCAAAHYSTKSSGYIRCQDPVPRLLRFNALLATKIEEEVSKIQLGMKGKPRSPGGTYGCWGDPMGGPISVEL